MGSLDQPITARLQPQPTAEQAATPEWQGMVKAVQRAEKEWMDATDHFVFIMRSFASGVSPYHTVGQAHQNISTAFGYWLAAIQAQDGWLAGQASGDPSSIIQPVEPFIPTRFETAPDPSSEQIAAFNARVARDVAATLGVDPADVQITWKVSGPEGSGWDQEDEKALDLAFPGTIPPIIIN